MNLRRLAAVVLLSVSGLGAGAGCGESGVVGGECVSGYIVCDGRCIDPSSDLRHCGSCNNTCPAEATCRDGECEGSTASGGSAAGGSAGEAGASAGGNAGSQSLGGSAGEPGIGGAMGSGASTASGGSGGGVGGSSTSMGGANTGGMGGVMGAGGTNTGTGGATTSTGGTGVGGATTSTGGATTSTGGATTGAGGATTSTGGASTGTTTSTSSGGMGGVGGVPCLPPYNTASQCGDCSTQCTGATPLCAPASGGGFECVPTCDTGLTECSGQCVDLQTDGQHCGQCNNACPSGVCVDANCIGATAGHIVYICMNYEQVFRSSAQTTLLGNAVYLARRDPVRVLAYTEHAETAVIRSTDRAIQWAAQDQNRTPAAITPTGSLAEIESDLTLTNYDVFLVYEQSLATAGQLGAAGTQLAATLDSFTGPGGVVIVMSGGSGVGEMPAFASNAGLATISGETPFSGELAHNQGGFDVIGFGVITPFLTLPSSCTLTTSEAPSSDTVFVVTDTDPSVGLGAPVVLHKIASP